MVTDLLDLDLHLVAACWDVNLDVRLFGACCDSDLHVSAARRDLDLHLFAA